MQPQQLSEKKQFHKGGVCSLVLYYFFNYIVLAFMYLCPHLVWVCTNTSVD